MSLRDVWELNVSFFRSRVFGILAGYEDQNDHDALRDKWRMTTVSGCVGV